MTSSIGRGFFALGRPGSVLLSHVLRHSTIGAEGFHGRVRNGIGCGPLAITTRSSKRERSPMIDDADKCVMKLSHRNLSLRATAALVQAERAISTGKLRTLLRFHTRPINVMVYHGSSGRTRFEVGFSLRCFQRLSRPHIATRRCRWRDNRYTRGASIPVLSY